MKLPFRYVRLLGLRLEGEWHEPIWTQDRHSKIAAWFARDRNEKESLIAAFPRLEKRGARGPLLSGGRGPSRRVEGREENLEAKEKTIPNTLRHRMKKLGIPFRKAR